MRWLLFASVSVFLLGTALSFRMPAHRQMRRVAPDEEACAPCGEFEISSRMHEIVPQLEAAESFDVCCNICENGGLEQSRSQSMSHRSRSRTGSDTCRCLCKSLKLNGFCPTDNCNGILKKVQCQNEHNTWSTACSVDGIHRCFERVFDDEQTYKNCLALTSEEELPPSILDSPDLTGGVEQCNCVCSYVERQESPTDDVPTSTPSDTNSTPCSPNFDCTLKYKTRRRISSRMDSNGDSFDDCVTKCTRSSDDDRTNSGKSRLTRSLSRAVSESDCHCYCSMIHDPCNEKPSQTDYDTDTEDSSMTKTKTSKTSSTVIDDVADSSMTKTISTNYINTPKTLRTPKSTKS